MNFHQKPCNNAVHVQACTVRWSELHWNNGCYYFPLALPLEAGCFCCLLFRFKNCLLLALGKFLNFCHCCLFLSLAISSGFLSLPLPRPLTLLPTVSDPWVCHLLPAHSDGRTHVSECYMPCAQYMHSNNIHLTCITSTSKIHIRTCDLYISVTMVTMHY